MYQFQVHSGENAATFSDAATLLAYLEALLGNGQPLSVVLPKLAIDAVGGLMALLKRHRIQVVLTADSAPEAVDYLAQTLLGATAGGVGGTIGGVWALSVLSRAGYLIPGVGLFLSAATILGLLAGAIAGFAVTRMGLRIRFVHADMVQVDLVPLGS